MGGTLDNEAMDAALKSFSVEFGAGLRVHSRD